MPILNEIFFGPHINLLKTLQKQNHSLHTSLRNKHSQTVCIKTTQH